MCDSFVFIKASDERKSLFPVDGGLCELMDWHHCLLSIHLHYLSPLPTDSAQTGSPVTSEAGRAVDADENQSSPPPPGLLNVTKGKKPSLQPKPSPPLLGIYSVRNPEDGNICLKAVLGVEFMVTVNKVSAITVSALKSQPLSSSQLLVGWHSGFLTQAANCLND